MTLTPDSKKRVVLPGAAPGDVFTCEQKGRELVLRRVHSHDSAEKTNKSTGSESHTKLEKCPEHSLGGPAEDHAASAQRNSNWRIT